MFVKRGTPLGQVRGLGSAKEGAHHWWMQRLTAVGNLLLFTWFLASILTRCSGLHGLERAELSPFFP